MLEKNEEGVMNVSTGLGKELQSNKEKREESKREYKKNLPM